MFGDVSVEELDFYVVVRDGGASDVCECRRFGHDGWFEGMID